LVITSSTWVGWPAAYHVREQLIARPAAWS